MKVLYTIILTILTICLLSISVYATEPWCQGVPGVCITNVTSTAFSVSWTTYGVDEEGYVRWGTNPGSIINTAYDDRSETASEETHHVTIRYLSPGWTYYFQVVSGGLTYSAAGGSPWQQTTGVSLAPSGSPDTRAIHFYQSNGSSPAVGTLVYVVLKNNDGGGTSGTSNVLSTVVTDSANGGIWLFDISRFRNIGLSAYFQYSAYDLIQILADGESDGYQFVEQEVGEVLDDVVLDACAGCYFYATGACYHPDQTNPSNACQICNTAITRVNWSISPATVVCRNSTGICDTTEYCTGATMVCPVDSFEPTSKVCLDASGPCDLPDHCAGTSNACLPEYKPPTTVCRASTDSELCDKTEYCPGNANTCPTDEFFPSTKVCNAASGDCDLDDHCSGSGATCVAEYKANTTVCRASADGELCDKTDYCTGTTAVCPTNEFYPSTKVCAAASGDCDLDDHCTGSSAVCTPEYKANSTVCRASTDGELCDKTDYCTGSAPVCPANEFYPASKVCLTASGDCDLDDHCSGTNANCVAEYKANTTVCRASTDGEVCDKTENCTGSTTTCPVDAFYPASKVCAAASGDCDLDDHCTGTNATCTPEYKANTVICRASVDGEVCDKTDYCTGGAPACPANEFYPASKVCLAASGDCDLDDHCTGSSAVCTPEYKPNTTVCRAARDAGAIDLDCDATENCTGSSTTCPVDAFLANGTTCNDANQCTSPDACNGAGTCVGTPHSGPFIQAVAPAAGASLAGGTTANITWNYGVCPSGANNGVDTIHILASVDGGATYPIEVAAAAPDDSGSYAWTVPAIKETDLRLKLEAKRGTTTTGNDTTDGDFAVEMPTDLNASINLNDEVVLTWTGGPADVYLVQGQYDNEATGWALFAEDVTSPWIDDVTPSGSDVYYRLTNANGTAYSAELIGKTYSLLNYGYALVTMPFEPATAMHAQDLLDLYNTDGDYASVLIRWDNGLQYWDIHYDAYPSYNNFAVGVGAGYFVKIEAPVERIRAGRVVQEPFTTHLGYDYALLGFPTGEWLTAQSVLGAMTGFGGVGHSIYKWISYSQTWDVHYNQYPGYNNYAIETEDGYFVRNDAASVDYKYNPLEIATSSTRTSMTISWVTTLPTTGWILYGPSTGAVSTLAAEDLAGLFDLDTSHQVTVSGLTANTTYYFDLVSSGAVRTNRGAHYSVKTQP
ncbi:MAG: hypothetical protein GX444_00770 [Myxococcales bacterium]|nr:hypothetical protein [Myxococcales bacterium]